MYTRIENIKEMIVFKLSDRWP